MTVFQKTGVQQKLLEARSVALFMRLREQPVSGVLLLLQCFLVQQLYATLCHQWC